MAVVTVAFSELDSWLQNQPANTVDTPYELEVTGLTASDIGDSRTTGTLGNVIKNNSTKYVDLSKTILPRVTSMNTCFHHCTSLTIAPNIPNSVTDIMDCFNGCESLTEVPNIPSSVTEIDYCFYYCTSLTTWKQSNTLDNVTSYTNAFEGCTNLTNIYTDKQVSIKSFLNTLYTEGTNNFPTNPDNLNFYTYDYPEASEVPFSELDTFLQGLLGNTAQTPYKLNVTELTASDIRPSITTGTLGKVLMNNSTKYVDLSETTLPSVVSMGGCFSGCSSLTESPVIPNGVTDMSSCFSYCPFLTEAPVIPNSVTNLSNCFVDCSSLTIVPVIPNGVVSLNNCFNDCTSLVEAPALPNSVTDINQAFASCTSLEVVPNIPASINDMRNAFFGCESLREITLFEIDLEKLSHPEGFAEYCFSRCTSLTKIGVPPSDQPTESDWHAFRLKFGASTVEGKVYDQTGTAVTIPQTTVTKATLELPIKTDELWFPSGLTDNEIDAIIEKVIQYRYTYWNKEVLDPAEKNFVLWADNPVNVKSNLKGMNPVDVVQSGNMNPVTSNAVADKISSLDVSSVGGSGKYISAISETDGKISATATDLGNMVPVDTVTSGNMHSVTSNAVAGVLGGIHFIGRITSSQSSRTYYKINNFLSYSVTTGGVFLLQSRGGELCLLSASRNDTATTPKVKRLLNNYTKIIGFTYSGTTLYICLEQWANFLSITQIGGDERKDVTISTATQSEYNSGTAITIET